MNNICNIISLLFFFLEKKRDSTDSWNFIDLFYRYLQITFKLKFKGFSKVHRAHYYVYHNPYFISQVGMLWEEIREFQTGHGSSLIRHTRELMNRSTEQQLVKRSRRGETRTLN